MKSCELVTLISAVACSISNCYSDDELAVLATAFTQLGDTLATILASEALEQSKNKETECVCPDAK